MGNYVVNGMIFAKLIAIGQLARTIAASGTQGEGRCADESLAALGCERLVKFGCEAGFRSRLIVERWFEPATKVAPY